MNLKLTIYLSLAIVALVIGIHRSIIDGQTATLAEAIGYNYWIFMLTLIFLFLFRNEKKKLRS